MQDNYVYMCTLVLKNTIFVIVFWFTTKQSTPNDVQLIITAPQIKQKIWCSIVVEMLRSINVENIFNKQLSLNMDAIKKFILG